MTKGSLAELSSFVILVSFVIRISTFVISLSFLFVVVLVLTDDYLNRVMRLDRNVDKATSSGWSVRIST
jgi:hypothetical protein